MFFKKKQVFVDTVERIFLDDTGARFFNLEVDPDRYEKGIATMKEILKDWTVQDITYTTDNNQPIDSSLLYQLKEIDLKFLPYDVYRQRLNYCLGDDAVNYSGARFFDAITRINTYIPLDILDAFRGKFLYAMLYGLPKTINTYELPPKELWLDLLVEHPWVPYLLVVQDLFDREEALEKLFRMQETVKHQQATVTRVTNTMRS